MERNIKLVEYITLRYADPICSIDLSDNCLLYGTMLGTSACYLINKKKLITLTETQEEHISGVQIEENRLDPKENKMYVCAGDEKIFIFNSINDDYNEIPKFELKSNYLNENDHFQNCEKCFTMLKNSYLVRTFIEFPTQPKTPSKLYDTQVLIKKITNLSEPEIGEVIKMTNYCVPFDFDGKYYIFIDFFDAKKRNFTIYNIESRNTDLSFEIESYKEKIGHISLLKILKNNLLFLVRDYNICEIRDMNFELKRFFNYQGNEILAFDTFYKDENNPESLIIIILDLYCNVIMYNYKTNRQELLFNLENLPIEQIIKDQRFFSMGYPYYIKVSNKYMAISSDYGCILVEHSPF